MERPDVASSGDELEVLKPRSIFHGRYEVLGCLKAGGMGAVYEVVDAGTRRRRALKTMLPSFVSDPDLRARFHLEATVTADIDSEHLVEVFDAGVDGPTGWPFLVMELLKGQTLAEALERRGRLAANDVVTLLHQASMALDKTHAAGVVHRDLKPENLFLTRRDDGSVRLKLLDFGIAKVIAQSSQAKTTRSFGTPLYMSPEQIRGDGDIGPRSDLYSMGHLAFAMLAGRPYWEPEARRSTGVYALLVKIMEGAPETPSVRANQFGARLPKHFDAWFARATALDPADRFDSASELVEELATVLEVPAPTSAHFLPSDAFGQAKIAGAPMPVARVATSSSGSRDADSTGALSSSRRFTSRSGREKLVWSGFIAATTVVALGLLGRAAFKGRTAPTPSAGVVEAVPSARTRAPEAPLIDAGKAANVPDTPRADGTGTAPSSMPKTVVSSAPKLPRLERRRPKPDSTTAPSSTPAPALGPARDPSDIR